VFVFVYNLKEWWQGIPLKRRTNNPLQRLCSFHLLCIKAGKQGRRRRALLETSGKDGTCILINLFSALLFLHNNFLLHYHCCWRDESIEHSDEWWVQHGGPLLLLPVRRVLLLWYHGSVCRCLINSPTWKLSPIHAGRSTSSITGYIWLFQLVQSYTVMYGWISNFWSGYCYICMDNKQDLSSISVCICWFEFNIYL